MGFWRRARGAAQWPLRCPAGPAHGVGLFSPEGHSPPEPFPTDRPIRIGLLNMHGGKGAGNRADLDRTAAALGGLDVIGLNEVHGPKAGRPDQAARLGRKLGLPWLFAPTERRFGRMSFGNGLLSRLPAVAWQRIPVLGTKKQRSFLLARLDWGGTGLNVLVTHVDRRRDRVEQLRTLLALFRCLAEPVVLMGDMNTPDDDPRIQALLAEPGVTAVPGVGQAGRQRVDWMVVRGLRATAGEMIDTDCSDHPLVRAELALPAQGEAGAASTHAKDASIGS